eukprot:8516989-Pyramimonas_sp.AAC.1
MLLCKPHGVNCTVPRVNRASHLSGAGNTVQAMRCVYAVQALRCDPGGASSVAQAALPPQGTGAPEMGTERMGTMPNNKGCPKPTAAA